MLTNKERYQAGHTDLVLWLRSHGEDLKRSGSEWEWNFQGERVTVRGNVWFDQYTQEGGDAVKFQQYFYNRSEEDAVRLYLSQTTSEEYRPRQVDLSTSPKEKKQELIPPPVHSDMRRVFAYLCKTRKIDPEVVSAFAHAHLLYESAEHHNAMFVGRDENGKTRHVAMRGTVTEGSFRQTLPGSEKGYSFHWLGGSEKLYVFEAPIDLLSYITLHLEGWQEQNYVALCGVSAEPVERLLDACPQLSEVCLCLDSDEAGQNATHRIAKQLLEEWDGLMVSAEVPELKDWNEDLIAAEEQEEAPQLVM